MKTALKKGLLLIVVATVFGGSSYAKQSGHNYGARRQYSKALIEACDNGQYDRAQDLLEHGAKVNGENEDGDTALIVATRNNNTKIMELLLRWYHARVNYQNRFGHTALMEAADCGFQSATRLLLLYNADTRVRDNLDRDAHFFAVMSGWGDELIDLLA